MPYPYGGLRIRPVISLGKVRSTVTIPTFDVLTNEPVGNCIDISGSKRTYLTNTGNLALFADPLNQLYFDCWIKPISFINATSFCVVFKRTTDTGVTDYITWNLTVSPELILNFDIRKNIGTLTTLQATERLKLGEWNHIGVSWNGTLPVASGNNGYLWVNGVKTAIALTANTIGPWYNPGGMYYAIGKFSAPTTLPVAHYLMDELRLWEVSPPDDYYINQANCPRAVSGVSDADSNLLCYFRCNNSALPLTSSAAGDSAVFGATAVPVTIVTTEEYPSSLMSSYPRVHIPLDEIGQNFTFKLRPERPSSADFGLAVYFTDEEGNDKRYFLWRSDGLRGVDYIPDYSGEKVMYTTARLEVWYNYLDRRVSLASPVTITLGQLLERSSYAAQGNTNIISPVADTTIAATFPLTFPITFNS